MDDMNWIQRKIYLYNVTFGLFMLDWWERYVFSMYGEEQNHSHWKMPLWMVTWGFKLVAAGVFDIAD